MGIIEVDARLLQAELRRKFAENKRKLKAAAVETAFRGQAHAVQLTNERGLVDRGAYKRGFRVEIEPPQLRNDTPYAGVIEHGRRPNRPGPPFAPILEWVERKLGLKGPEAEAAARAIRNAIQRRGTPPHLIMRRTFLRMRRWYREEVRDTLGR